MEDKDILETVLMQFRDHPPFFLATMVVIFEDYVVVNLSDHVSTPEFRASLPFRAKTHLNQAGCLAVVFACECRIANVSREEGARYLRNPRPVKEMPHKDAIMVAIYRLDTIGQVCLAVYIADIHGQEGDENRTIDDFTRIDTKPEVTSYEGMIVPFHPTNN